MNGSGEAWLHFYKKSKGNLSFREALVTIVALLGNVSFSNSIPEEQSDIDAILPYSGDAFRDARFPLSNIHNPLSWFKMASAWETFASEWFASTKIGHAMDSWLAHPSAPSTVPAGMPAGSSAQFGLHVTHDPGLAVRQTSGPRGSVSIAPDRGRMVNNP